MVSQEELFWESEMQTILGSMEPVSLARRSTTAEAEGKISWLDFGFGLTSCNLQSLLLLFVRMELRLLSRLMSFLSWNVHLPLDIEAGENTMTRSWWIQFLSRSGTVYSKGYLQFLHEGYLIRCSVIAMTDPQNMCLESSWLHQHRLQIRDTRVWDQHEISWLDSGEVMIAYVLEGRGWLWQLELALRRRAARHPILCQSLMVLLGTTVLCLPAVALSLFLLI